MNDDRITLPRLLAYCLVGTALWGLGYLFLVTALTVLG